MHSPGRCTLQHTVPLPPPYPQIIVSKSESPLRNLSFYAYLNIATTRKQELRRKGGVRLPSGACGCPEPRAAAHLTHIRQHMPTCLTSIVTYPIPLPSYPNPYTGRPTGTRTQTVLTPHSEGGTSSGAPVPLSETSPLLSPPYHYTTVPPQPAPSKSTRLYYTLTLIPK